MYAIVDIAGQQLKVEKNQKVYVHRLEAEEGSKVDFDKVLLIDNEGKIDVGTPIVKDMIVSATVVSHLKGDKVKVFKKKRRKGYQKLNGHRQYLTEILIEDIAVGKVTKKAPEEKPKKAPKAEAETKATEPKAEKKESPKTEAKTTAEKKTTTAKKPAAKKETAAEKKTATAKKPAAKKETAAKTAKKAADKPAAKKAEPKKDKSEE